MRSFPSSGRSVLFANCIFNVGIVADPTAASTSASLEDRLQSRSCAATLLQIGSTDRRSLFFDRKNGTAASQNESLQRTTTNSSKQVQASKVTNLTSKLSHDDIAKVVVPLVHIGIFLNTIDHISSRFNSFTGELILNSKYRKHDLGSAISHIPLEFVAGEIKLRTELRRWEEADYVMTTERVAITTKFDGAYNLFPFDEQTVVVSVQMKGLDAKHAQFTVWQEYSGIRPSDAYTSSRFKRAQFMVKNWSMVTQFHDEPGMLYSKSRGELRLIVCRDKVYYVLISLVLPTMIVGLATVAFTLPISLIVPRIAVSFTSFLAMFVHIKQMMDLVPEGVWCWLLTDLLFFVTILSIGVIANIFSARLFYTKDSFLSKRHDALLGLVLPLEFCAGQTLLYLGRPWHVSIGIACISVAILFHLWMLLRFVNRLRVSKDDEVRFSDGCALVLPCIFAARVLMSGADGAAEEVGQTVSLDHCPNDATVDAATSSRSESKQTVCKKDTRFSLSPVASMRLLNAESISSRDDSDVEDDLASACTESYIMPGF